MRCVLAFSALAAWSIAINSPAAFGSESDAKPNVLLILVDNVGYGELGCYGNRQVKTPSIDRLASQGVRCTGFYIGAPSCSPSRGALLTGRHPERNGLNYQLRPQENLGGVGLPLAEKILPQYLKPLGYATAAFGKWNIGFAPGARPTERGFDEFLGHASGNINYYTHVYHGQNDLRRGTGPVDLSGKYSTDLFADAAIDFIRRHRQRPWCVYLPFNAVHFLSPINMSAGETPQWQAPAKYLALYGCKADEPDEQKRFRTVLSALDDAIGRVVTTVDELALGDRTIVIFLSDNGAFMLPGRGKEVQSNAPLREGGVTLYEGGTRVPAIIRWPGRIPPGSVCRAMLSSLDLLPMILAAAGQTPPADRALDGRDPTAALAGKTESHHHCLWWVWEKWRAIRVENYKLLRRSPTSPWELYDLQNDLAESRDMAPSRPELVDALAREFDRRHQEVRNDPSRGISTRDSAGPKIRQ